MTVVVNKRHQAYDVYIGRGSKWGNPYAIGPNGSRENVIRLYEDHLKRRPDLMAALPELKGKRLGCFCAPLPCHGDILKKYCEAL